MAADAETHGNLCRIGRSIKDKEQALRQLLCRNVHVETSNIALSDVVSARSELDAKAEMKNGFHNKLEPHSS